ncbi:hypothetical protein AA12717_2956 [Gluconacetobacter sacchari DSM 12717]|uniref:Uncharacterized protein n=2 Tax=Gluconacetobacter sacchari TaxID=92759 RepID=A0A7W4NL53_9PROT|nr:hypothetical protein [Gluconacetobacter sacchari]MBB2159747.1 hypothetical protein [Gluconacetobacter sacchari]GBQ28451.1 hypothetical protein AA12717_2956 [Gluconacetobacter sacchari DSM 12717]
MDPVSQIAMYLWPVVSPYLPEHWRQVLPLLALACCPLAGFALQVWTPAPGSRWVVLWQLLTWIANARGRNAPVSQPGIKSLAIPLKADRAALARQIGVDPAQANPRRLLAAPRAPIRPPDPG